MKKAFLFSIFIIVILVFSGDTKSSNLSENRVRERVVKYLNLFFGGHYEKAWEMLMPEVRGPLAWSKERWVGQWKRYPPKEKLLAVKFKKIKITQTEGHYFAYVYMFLKFKLIDKNGKEIVEEREVPDGWGFVNNDWYRFEQD